MGNDQRDLIWAYRDANPTLPWKDLIRFIAARTRVPEQKVEACLVLKLQTEAGLRVTM